MNKLSFKYLIQIALGMGLLMIIMAACSSGSKSRNKENVSMANQNKSVVKKPMAARQDTATYKVVMKNFKFIPNTLNLPVNKPVKLIFKNKANIVHAFMAGKNGVRADKKGFKKSLFRGVDVKHDGGMAGTNPSFMIGVKPHTKASITFTLPAKDKGTWKFGCFKTIGNKTHYSMGMKGKIHVR